MHDPKRLGLINALLVNRADTPVPTPPRTLSSLSRGLLGLDGGLGALSSFHAPQPRVRGALERIFASSEHDRLVEKLGIYAAGFAIGNSESTLSSTALSIRY